MHNRFLHSPPRALLLGASFSLLTLAHAPLRAQEAPANTPRTALITSLRGGGLTLDIGAQQNAVRGAVYSITRDGRVRARAQVIEVGENDSQARILNADDDFVLAVGDTLRFDSVQPVVEPATPTQPATPVTPPTQPTTPVAPPDQPGAPPIAPPAAPAAGAAPIAAGATVSATVLSTDGATVTFDAGADKGVRAGSRVAIARNGDVVALARITVVEANRSTGEVIFSDPASGGAQAGDSAPLLAWTGTFTPATPTDTVPDAVPTPAPIIGTDGVPAAPVRFETGASNEVVPRADETYDYLGALAASKLLPREYPAHLFHDEGPRNHRTEEDLTLSRSQIALLTLGALRAVSAGGEDTRVTGSAAAALNALGEQYRKELQVLGATPSELLAIGVRPLGTVARNPATGAAGAGNVDTTVEDAITGRIKPRFTLGVSGREQASVIGGSGRDTAPNPFSETQGGLRTRSGFETRTNIFGSVGDDLRFFAQVNAGNRIRRDEDGGFHFNEAYAQYNARKLLRGLTIKAGRDEVWWGPGHFGTLLLSDTAGPLNQIQTTFERGSYRFQSLYAPIDRGPSNSRRSIYGHNLSVQVGKQTRIGFAESLLAPRSGLDGLSFVGAFSPIPLFALERARKRNTTLENGNILTQAYIESSLARGVRGTAEFLIDDLGVNANNILRDRLGSLIGVHLFTPRDPAKLGLFAEYANLQGRTYLALRSRSDSDYYYRNSPLGYPVAPVPGVALNGGAQSLRLEGYWRALPRLRVGGGLELAALNSEDTFRTRQQVIRLRASYDLSRNFSLVARVQRTATDSPNLLQGTSKQNVFQLEIVHTY